MNKEQEKLIDAIFGGISKEFTPYYDYDGKSLNVYIKNSSDYQEDITDNISVFRDITTNEIVGFRIWNLERTDND